MLCVFPDFSWQNHSGYAGQIHQAFVKGVVEPVVEWKKEVKHNHHIFLGVIYVTGAEVYLAKLPPGIVQWCSSAGSKTVGRKM